MHHTEKLARLRKVMNEHGIHAYIIPSSDPHISEYLPDRFKAIEWMSGFTGSAGALVITPDFAGLWTDSRYFVQADEQLVGTGFELVKLKVQGTAEYAVWLGEVLQPGQVVAFDGTLASVSLVKTVIGVLSPLDIRVKGNEDLLEEIWQDRPALPTANAYLISESTTGQSATSKIEKIKAKLAEKPVEAHLISSLDDLAWTLNIRGNDVPCNPVVLGFLLITRGSTVLFINKDKLSETDTATITGMGISIKDYGSVFQEIAQLTTKSILLDPKRTCFTVYVAVPENVDIVEDTNPSTFLKAVKNNTEIELSRKTMVKDGVALTKFFKWLEENVASGKLSEISIAERLRAFREEQHGFVDISFDTIAGYLEHGALPHYKATEKSNVTLKTEGLLLVDSGGQYNTGTTDITRVVSLGNIKQEEKEDYTIVLKGMIEGSLAIYPKGTRGYQIDAITRRPIWEALRNYGHGTGHGIGFFLNVHEGPHVFNPSNVDVAIEEGMITSIEPGIYRQGKYGIRIENLVLSRSISSNEFGDFMAFETLTICYIDTALIDKNLLDHRHIDWLNGYNAWVYEQLTPHLYEEERAWLKKKTQAI